MDEYVLPLQEWPAVEHAEATAFIGDHAGELRLLICLAVKDFLAERNNGRLHG